MVTVPVIGEKGVKINVNEPKKANFPSRKLTKFGGQFPSWNSNGDVFTGHLEKLFLSMTFLQLKHLKINKKRD